MRLSSEPCGTRVRKPSAAINSEWQTKSGKPWKKLMNPLTARENVLRFYYGRPQAKNEQVKNVSN
jgi:hypothetical protein